MNNILLLGDSIRMNYCGRVKDALGGEYDVRWPGENCRFAKYMLNSLRFWLSGIPEQDLVCFNAGIWDIGTTANDEEDAPFTSLDDYVRDMTLIGRQIMRGAKRAAFVTTSAVRDEKPDVSNAVVLEYNNAVVSSLAPLGVDVIDLYAFMRGREDELVSDDLVHLSERGIAECGDFIAGKIKKIIS